MHVGCRYHPSQSWREASGEGGEFVHIDERLDLPVTLKAN